MKPEERARQIIDQALTQAGWAVQDFATFNLTAARGVAIREFPLTTRRADYPLYVDSQVVGVIGARKVGTTQTFAYESTS